jgi:hypothetical protein
MFLVRRLLTAVVFALLAASGAIAHESADHAVSARTPKVDGWWKGNTHTHTWWSDGDRPPESVSAWYREHGYNFLVLSDHNRMQEGEFWYRIDSDIKTKALAEYVRDFGADWVEQRVRDGKTEVKLKTLDEFRSFFEARNEFIFIRGMEITDRLEQHPVHLNGVNLEKVVVPQGGSTVPEMLQKNVDAVVEQGRRSGRPMFAHVNHPNFFYAITAEDLISLNVERGDGFVEVYNGHSGVRNYGDATHPAMERMWDIVLAKRLGERKVAPIMGVATDDAHQYTSWGVGQVNPGRGWVMVRAPRLTPDSIASSMKRGDFYNSTGVTLQRLEMSGGVIDLEVLAEPGVTYTVEFVGTLRGVPLDGVAAKSAEPGAPGRQSQEYSAEIGKVLRRIEGPVARFVATGDEMYVRARVVSSKPHSNPYAEGDREMAWTQPLVFRP